MQARIWEGDKWRASEYFDEGVGAHVEGNLYIKYSSRVPPLYSINDVSEAVRRSLVNDRDVVSHLHLRLPIGRDRKISTKQKPGMYMYVIRIEIITIIAGGERAHLKVYLHCRTRNTMCFKMCGWFIMLCGAPCDITRYVWHQSLAKAANASRKLDF